MVVVRYAYKVHKTLINVHYILKQQWVEEVGKRRKRITWELRWDKEIGEKGSW